MTADTKIHPTQSDIDTYVHCIFRNVNGVYDILNSLGQLDTSDMSDPKPMTLLRTANFALPNGTVDYLYRYGDSYRGRNVSTIPSETIINPLVITPSKLTPTLKTVESRAFDDIIKWQETRWRIGIVNTRLNIIAIYSDNIVVSGWNKSIVWDAVVGDPTKALFMVPHCSVYSTNGELKSILNDILMRPINNNLASVLDNNINRNL